MALFKKRLFLDFAGGHDNPSAIYDEGAEAKRRLEEARTRVARVLHVQAHDIVFTSGGTESDNLALLGVFEALRGEAVRPHIVISSVEHPAVRECAKEIERRGGEVSVVPVDEDGELGAENVARAVKENTILVSVMYVNSETGAIHPVSKISRLIQEQRKKSDSRLPYVHTDASQAAATLPLDVSKLGVDLESLDASKAGGPKGVGLLVVRPGVRLRPIIFGGGQERGLRAGTENVESIERFAEALEKAQGSIEKAGEKYKKIKKAFAEEISQIEGVVINSPEDSVPNIISISVPGKLHEFLAVKLNERGVSVSTGSSCKNMGAEEKEALRFSFGPETEEKDARRAARLLSEVML